MSKLASLKAASSLRTFAPLLGLPASALAFTLYKIPQDKKYTTFSIPKKTGGTREIKAPIERLKRLQRYLVDLLTECRIEIEAKTNRKVVSHAFRSRASISTNAAEHRKRRYVLNLDLEDFFPTFNYGRVRGYFMKNKDFGLHERVATVIAQIACDGFSLPQGSPCSPIISDLIAHLLDVKMLQLARKHRCTYSRYADDITFSTNRRSFPQELAFQVASESSAWALGDELLDQVSRAGFSVNHKKTRVQYRGSLQVVTGLSVNEKVNIRAAYYRGARAMCAGLFATGTYFLGGKVVQNGIEAPKGSLAQLEGILNHIYFIKGVEANRTSPKIERASPAEALPTGRGIVKLYERFLFFKKFIILDRPVIVCEGKTDSIYLDAAIRHLPAYAGTLFEEKGGKKASKIGYFNYSGITRHVMSLGGGASQFPPFINRYAAMVRTYQYAPLKHPVILLIDNDDGAKGASGIFKSIKHTTITHNTALPFYRITHNLYLVKTPEAGVDGYSKIEDLFSQETLEIELNGKKFNSGGKINPLTDYGKLVFAERIVAPQAANIDFSGFVPLLDRIVATINYHSTIEPTSAV